MREMEGEMSERTRWIARVSNNQLGDGQSERIKTEKKRTIYTAGRGERGNREMECVLM